MYQLYRTGIYVTLGEPPQLWQNNIHNVNCGFGLTELIGSYHLWQSQDDNGTAPIEFTDKNRVQIRRCEWEIFHIQLM